MNRISWAIIAQMAKLVDALVSGTSVSNDVQVRVLFWAQEVLRFTAQMVKLVDTPAWGAGARKGVQVRVLFWAPMFIWYEV